MFLKTSALSIEKEFLTSILKTAGLWQEGSCIWAFQRLLFWQLCLWCSFTCSSATSTSHIRLTVATIAGAADHHIQYKQEDENLAKKLRKEDRLSNGILY